MTKNKRQPMSQEALQLVAARFKVLADPMRLRILQVLEAGENGVSALAEAVESTQPNVSKHLKILQEAGMLARRQEGNTVYYSISDPTVFELCDAVCSTLAERFAAHASAFSTQPIRPVSNRRR
ncbi:MAG: winged helix-turn-helix transcriptional regulator [Acidobacteria bacterium]|nr:winged helix-turn-helix transcriptional regulator [Acidobacteriota bacterium]